MMKRVGVLLVMLGFVQLFGNAMQGRIPDQVLIVGAMMVIGGLIIWSLERVRDAIVAGRPPQIVSVGGYVKKPRREPTTPPAGTSGVGKSPDGGR